MNSKYVELYYIRAIIAPSGNLAIELNFKQVKGQTVQPV